MQKNMLGILLILILSLTGCGLTASQYSENSSLEDALQYENGDIIIDSQYEFLAFITDFSDVATYTIISRLFEEKNVEVSFPEVEMLNEERQVKINNLILSEERKMLRDFLEWGDDLTLDIDYEIKANSNRLLSIVYIGLGFVQGAARPFWVFHTININVETGEKILLSDVVNVNERFIELLKSENAVFINPDQREPVIDGFISTDRFLQRLQNADNSEFIGTAYKSGIFTYFTNDSLGISISVLHVLGGYARLEINYDFLK